MANRLARARVTKGKALTSPSLTYSCLQTLLQGYEREVFAILFLDSQHRVIKFEELFHGTLDAASVYPREVVKAALAYNAAAVILVHNHPSGCRSEGGCNPPRQSSVSWLANGYSPKHDMWFYPARKYSASCNKNPLTL